MGQGAKDKRQVGKLASWQEARGKRQVGKRQPSDSVGHICQFANLPFATCYLLLASLHNPSHNIWNYKKESCYGICIQNEN